MAVALLQVQDFIWDTLAQKVPAVLNGAHPSDAPISLEMVASELMNALCRRKSTSSWR